MAVCLITVVSGKPYRRYAEKLFESAHEHFQIPLRTVMLQGLPGWPAATLYRYHIVLEHAEELTDDYLFLCDADMRFEGSVGEEILGKIVATRHPGYVNRKDFPYETRPASTAFVPKGNVYYAGGFVGGERLPFLNLAADIADAIDEDDRNGILARWHDESHLNRVLAKNPPTFVLSPAYCHPDDDSAYRGIWPEVYARKLVALDKSPAERNGR